MYIYIYILVYIPTTRYPAQWRRSPGCLHCPVLNLSISCCFSKLPSQLPMFIRRTWSNGRLTSTRMHDANTMPCIFGCDEEVDSFPHYVRCEVWWALVYTCINSNDSSLLQQSIEERCCICNISPSSLMRLYSASATYDIYIYIYI